MVMFPESTLTEWSKDFQLSGMLNKLVNLKAEINTVKTIDDSVMKSVIDRAPMSVNRKNRDIVNAVLPAIHIFGGNGMPKSMEGASGAYNRRVIVIRTETVQDGDGGGDGFSRWAWDTGPEGVLKAALEGLERLMVRGGRFSVSEASRREVAEWQAEGDAVAQFLEAVGHGEIEIGGSGRVVVHPDARVTSAALYTRFVAFQMDTNPGGWVPSAKAFGKRLVRDKRLTPAKISQVRGWVGIGLMGDGAGARY